MFKVRVLEPLVFMQLVLCSKLGFFSSFKMETEWRLL